MRAAVKAGSCDRCGTPFVGRLHRRFCSENCRKRYQDATTGRVVCGNCGELAGTRSKANGYDRCGACRQAEADRVRSAVLEGYKAGRAAYEIAEEVGVSHSFVTRLAWEMRRAGLDVPYAPMGGAAHRDYRVWMHDECVGEESGA